MQTLSLGYYDHALAKILLIIALKLGLLSGHGQRTVRKPFML